MALALATGIFAPISSIFLALYQSRITSDLERLKMGYSQEVEKVKAALSLGVELKKTRITGKIRAFNEMLTAAHFLYFAVRKQIFDSESEHAEISKEADRRAAEASSLVWYLSDADRHRWFDVYQRAIHLLAVTKSLSHDDRSGVFDEYAPALGDAIKELEDAARVAFEEANEFGSE